MGGYLYPSVLRSPGVSPQKCRAAHGPLHPAVKNPPRLCLFGDWFFCSVLSGYMSGLSVWYFWSLGSRCCLVWCPSRLAPCSDWCSLSSLSFFGCWDVSRRRFSLFLFVSLSLRRWGTTNPCGVCVSPSVSSSWPRTPTPNRTPCSAPTPRLRPAPVFFFLVVVARLPARCFARFLSWFWLVFPGVGLGRSVFRWFGVVRVRLFCIACMH